MATTKPKKNGRQNYDWSKIKADYISNADMSLRKLATKYGVSVTTIRNKSKAENWFATKKETQEKIATQAVAKLVTKKANALAKELESVEKLSDILSKALLDEQQFNRYIVNETVSDQESSMSTSNEKIFEALDTRRLREAASTLKLIEEMKRSMLNIQKMSEVNRELREQRRLEMEEERLKMDQQRMNLGTGDEEDHGILILPEVLHE